MKLTRREKTMVIIGFVLVAVVAYVFYFAMPQMNSQTALAGQILTAGTTLQTLQAKAATIENLKKQISSTEEELASETKNIPHGSNDAIILLYLRQLADRTGTDISVTFSDKPMESGAFVRRLVAIEGTTSYAKVSKLLEELSHEELFNSVQIISAKYEPVETPIDTAATATAGATQTEAPAPTPAALSTDTVKAHIELYFDAFKLVEGEQPSTPPLPANVQNRTINLFPD